MNLKSIAIRSVAVIIALSLFIVFAPTVQARATTGIIIIFEDQDNESLDITHATPTVYVYDGNTKVDIELNFSRTFVAFNVDTERVEHLVVHIVSDIFYPTHSEIPLYEFEDLGYYSLGFTLIFSETPVETVVQADELDSIIGIGVSVNDMDGNFSPRFNEMVTFEVVNRNTGETFETVLQGLLSVNVEDIHYLDFVLKDAGGLYSPYQIVEVSRFSVISSAFKGFNWPFSETHLEEEQPLAQPSIDPVIIQPIPTAPVVAIPEPESTLTIEVVETPEPVTSTIHSANTATVTNAHFLNLRRGAGVSYNAFAVLSRGDEVTVLGRRGGWVNVETSRGTGWVFGRYLDI